MLRQLLTKYWKEIATVVLLFGIALGVRLTYQHEAIVRNQIISDARSYFLGGYNLYTFGVYSIQEPKDAKQPPPPDATRSPGYSLFLLPFFYTSANHNDFLNQVLTTQAVMGALTCVMAFILARLLLSLFCSFWVGLLTTLSPHLIAMDFLLLTESLYTFILLLAILLLIFSWRARKPLPALPAGCLFGMVMLIKDSALLLGPFMALTFLFSPRQEGKKFVSPRLAIPKIFFFLLGIVLVFGPYLLRNETTFGRPFPASGRGWDSVIDGAYIDLVHTDPGNYGYPYRDDKDKAAMSTDKAFFFKTMSERVKERPLDYLEWYLLGKILIGFQWDELTGHHDVYLYPMKRFGFHANRFLFAIHKTMKMMHWPLFWLALGGGLTFCWIFYKRSVKDEALLFVPVTLLFIYMLSQLVVLFPGPRFTFPARPYLYLLALWMLNLLWERFHGSDGRKFSNDRLIPQNKFLKK